MMCVPCRTKPGEHTEKECSYPKTCTCQHKKPMEGK